MSDYNFDNTREEKRIVFDNTHEEKKKNTSSSFVFDNERDESRKRTFTNTREGNRKKKSSASFQNCSAERTVDLNRLNNELNESSSQNRSGYKKKSNRSRRFFLIAGVLLIGIALLSMIIGNIVSKRHQKHLIHISELLDDAKVVDAVDYYNKKMFKDNECQQESLSSLRSFATNTFSSYISEQILYEEARNTLQALAKVNDDAVSDEINNLLFGIEQLEMANEENNNSSNEEELEVTDDQNKENSSDTVIIETAYLDNCTILESDEYDGNQGDSFVYPIGQHQYTRGRCDISGKTYYHGIEAWIARWNYEDEISWAYSIFALPENMNSLSGEVVLIDSYNTTNFDSTLYFINADTDTDIKSYHLTPDTIPFDFSIPVSGIQKLKVFVTDNRAVSGGTSFGLVNAALDINEVNSDSIDEEIE